MKKKLSMLFTALSIGSIVWMGYDFFNRPDTAPAGQSAQAAQSVAASDAAPATETVGGVTLTQVDPGEAFGLMLIGAQNKDRLATLTDARDLCTVVKGNAILNNSKLGERRFTKEFETCADRTLHHEAAFLHAGSVFGADNILKMSGADYCGVFRIAMGRAMFKYALEAGKEIPDHDSTLENINAQLDECAAAKGEFTVSGEVWNDYANQALILPFYAPKNTPAPSR